MSYLGEGGARLRDFNRGSADASLCANEEFLLATFAHAPIGMAISDADGQFLQVNAAFCTITGYRPEEIDGLDLFSMMHQDDLPEARRRFQQLFAGSIPGFGAEMRYVRADGTAVPVQCTSSPVRDHYGQVLHAALLIQDISDSKRADQECLALAQRLAQCEKLEAMGRLAAGVAHDMNNTLTAIVGPLELLQRSLADGSATQQRIRQDIDVAARAAADAMHGVRRLLRVARQSREPEWPERQRVHLGALLDDVVARTRLRWRDDALAQGRHIEMVVEPGQAPDVLASAAELRDALINLVNNAVDALPAGGMITLRTASATGPDGRKFAVLSVADTGIGMDAVTQERLFEPYFTTKPLGKGTGLGMPMVYAIVERHGGAIDISSVPGRGTRIALQLPAYDDGLHADRDEALPPLARQWRLFLVDDEATVRTVATRLLQRDGHQVTAVASAEAALALLAGDDGGAPFDAIVTDVGLPGMSGWHLIDHLRSIAPRLPIIVATGWGYSVAPEQLAGHDISPRQVVAKPYSLAVLRRALETVITARRE